MKNNINGMKKLMYFNLSLIVFGWASLGLSFEPWEGEIINDVNLREAPGLDQKNLTDLKQGVTVTIIDKNRDWCQVIVKGKQPERKNLILRKLGIPGLFTHGSAKQSELKGWVLEKDIKRVAEKAEAPVAALVKEEEIKLPASGEEKANVTQEAQAINATPPVVYEAKITEPLANAEQEKAKGSLVKQEEKKMEVPSAIEESKKVVTPIEPSENKKIKSSAVTTEASKVSDAFSQTKETSTSIGKSLPLSAKVESNLLPTLFKKEEIKAKESLTVKPKVLQEPQQIKDKPSLDQEAGVIEPIANAGQEKAQALLIGKEEKKIESSAITEEKKIAEASAQPPEIISRTEKSVFSEKSEEKGDREQRETSLAQDKQGLAGEAKGVMFLREVLRGIALLATGILSCLAFIFSFRAYRIAQECYQMMIRFQINRQSSHENKKEE